MKEKDNKEKARELYQSGYGSLAKIAKTLGENQNTVKAWKKRDKEKGSDWVKMGAVKVAPKKEMGAPEEEAIEQPKKENDKVKITVKEEIVINAYCGGKSMVESYMEGYPKSKEWKRKSVQDKAHFFFRQDKVRERVETIKGRVVDNVVMDRSKFMNKLFLAFDMAIGDVKVKKVDKAMGTITGTAEVYETDLKAITGIGKEICSLMDWYPKEKDIDNKESATNKALDKLEERMNKRFGDKNDN